MNVYKCGYKFPSGDPQIPSSQQQSSLIIQSYPIQLDLSVEGYVMLAGWMCYYYYYYNNPIQHLQSTLLNPPTKERGHILEECNAR